MIAAIRVKWSKRERDLVVVFEAFPNSKSDAGLVIDHLTRLPGLFDRAFTKELEARGFDLTTLRFSIDLKPNEAQRRRGGA